MSCSLFHLPGCYTSLTTDRSSRSYLPALELLSVFQPSRLHRNPAVVFSPTLLFPLLSVGSALFLKVLCKKWIVPSSVNIPKMSLRQYVTKKHWILEKILHTHIWFLHLILEHHNQNWFILKSVRRLVEVFAGKFSLWNYLKHTPVYWEYAHKY